MIRHQYILACGMAIGAMIIPNPTQAKPSTKPNILFVFADQFRSMELGCYGGQGVKTPNFDRLAREGVQFTHAISTYPVCSPYRAMLLTGNFPVKNGMVTNDHIMHNPTPYLAEVCKSAGYSTGYIGKWHIDGISGRTGYIPKERWHGFDFWRTLECTHNYFGSKYFYQEEMEPRTWVGYDAVSQTDAACKYITERSKSEPFCLFLSWGPPHGPYIAPKEYLDRFDAGRIKLRENVNDFAGAEKMWHESDTDMGEVYQKNRDKIMVGMLDTNNVEIRKWYKGYYAAIATLDDLFGKILKTLEKNGQLDNTIIVFTSDHGDNLGSHRQHEKELPYEESLSIPFLIRYPAQIKGGTKTDALLSPVDMMPTILSLANRSCPKVDGKDISGAARGKDENLQDAVLLMKTLWLGSIYVTSGAGPWRGARTKQYTYARKSDTKKPWMLFDNDKDPYQYTNLVEDPKYAALVKQLDQKTTELLAKAGDPEDPNFFAKRIQDERRKLGLPERKDLYPEFVEPGSGFKKYGKTIYLDANQSFENRTKDLISHLSVEEKAMLLDHKGPILERLNILSDNWNQCLHGVVWNKPTTMFPIPTAMGATWDPALIHEVATTISDEARAIYNGWHNDPNFDGDKKGLIYRAPVVNISRNPYWGRINEIYSEDPYLTGRMGVAYVKGLQGNDHKYLKLVSTLKHYVVNNVETDRQKLNAIVDERWLFEYWLPHFRDCIVEGQAQSVMASYNAVNGVPNNINKYLLTDILKKQWGFEGFVVSDLGGVRTMVQGHEAGKMTYEEAVAKSIIAGCDFSDKEYRENIPKAVAMGILPIERLDDAVYRVMRDRFRLGEFDAPELVPYSQLPMRTICSPEHRKLSLKVAQKSIVLLKNSGNLLPLDKTKLKTIAVLGPHANIFTAGGYSGKVINPVTPLQGIKNRAATGTEILTTAGAEIPALVRKNSPVPPFNYAQEIQTAVGMAKKADVVIIYIGTTLATEAEGRDRTTLSLPGNQQELVEAVMKVNPKTIVVEMNAGPLAIPWIKEHVPAIVEAWWGGEEGGNAIADVLFGAVNPGAKMPLTVYASDSQVPPQDEYDISKGFTYMYLKGAPLFPFGHGLSYTSFKYSGLKIESKKIKADGEFSVDVTVKNTGTREGDEVVQLYIHDTECRVVRPVKELRAFERITLKPGERKTVTLKVAANKLAFYDVKTHSFTVEPGLFDAYLGSSSEDIRLTGHFEVIH